jgi:hypothetical protein
MSTSITSRQSLPSTRPVTALRADPRTEAPQVMPSLVNRSKTSGSDATSTFVAASARPMTANQRAPSNKEQALARIDTLLNPEVHQDKGFRTVTHQGQSGREMSDAGMQRCQQMVHANASVERQALSELSAGDQRKYQEVKETLGQSANDGLQQLALQKLLFEGKLPGGKDFKDQGSTLDQLHRAATGEHADGIRSSELAGTLARELATPSSISQGKRGTCAPTALSIGLAENNPAEYARIVNGLASEQGKVELADGKTTLTRAADTSLSDDGSERSLSQRLLAPVFQEVTNGSENYNDRTNEGRGSQPQDVDQLNDAIYGRNMGFMSVGDGQRGRAMNLLDKQLSQGENVLVGLDWNEGKHKVLVTGTSEEKGKEYVDFINPWGEENRIERDVFAGRIDNINEGTRSADPSLDAVRVIMDTLKGLF